MVSHFYKTLVQQKRFKYFRFNKFCISVFVIIILASIGVYISYTKYSSNILQVPYNINAPEEIRGEIITLRKPKTDYFIDAHNMLSPTVRKNIEYTQYASLEWSIAVFRMELEKMNQGRQLWYFIFDNKENKLVGSIDIREPDPLDPGQVGCWLNEHYWGGGRIQEALKLAIKTYFDLKPHVKSLTAHVRSWNKRSYYALKKGGFVDIGFSFENGKPARHILEIRNKKFISN